MSGPEGTTLLLIAVTVAIVVAWYLSYAAARLDRLHAKVEGALSALDAQLIRRAEASIELASSGLIEPASALLLADAATDAATRQTEHPLADDLLDGQHFAGLEDVESTLTAALAAAVTPEVVAQIQASQEPGDDDPLGRVLAAALRVQLARSFYNDAVADVRRVRAKTIVRVFRLAGRAALPEPLVFDDELPVPDAR